MTRPGDIGATTARPRRWLAALACALLLGQAFAVAHALDTQTHVDDRSCQLCQVANPAGGAATAIPEALIVAPAAAHPGFVVTRIGPTGAPSLLPPSRAPPAHLTIS